jgi:inorganic pyrophosphatase
MKSILSIPHQLDRASMSCRAIIETPKGSRTKFDYDPETGLFLLDRILPAGMSFPLDFGFIPSTRAEDGDPVDVLVLHDEPIPVGVLLEVRLIGVIIGEQREDDGVTVRNDRLIGVSKASYLHQHLTDAQQLTETFLDQLARFWVNYNELRGRKFDSKGIHGPGEAAALIEAASSP